MTLKLLWIALLSFGAFTLYALYDVGYWGILEGGLLTSGSQQILFDLVVALSLFIAWMLKDAKQRGINPLPWVLGTLALGSIAPLVYLILRERKR